VLVFGNEELGISDEMREHADERFFLPMAGFAESFNLSVACATTLATVRNLDGLPADMPEERQQRLLLKWLMLTIRAATQIVKRAGVLLPGDFKLHDTIGGRFTTK